MKTSPLSYVVKYVLLPHKLPYIKFIAICIPINEGFTYPKEEIMQTQIKILFINGEI
jgi:hypothetical protein